MTYQLKHPFLGLLAGALFGGFVVSLWFSVPGILSGLAEGELRQTLQELRNFMPTVMIIAAIIFAFGLIFVASPAWVYLHSSGRTHPKHALQLGLATCFVVSLGVSLTASLDMGLFAVDGRALILDGKRTVYGWFVLLKDAVLFANLGGMVALVIWRVAYRRVVTPPPARPSGAPRL